MANTDYARSACHWVSGDAWAPRAGLAATFGSKMDAALIRVRRPAHPRRLLRSARPGGKTVHKYESGTTVARWWRESHHRISVVSAISARVHRVNTPRSAECGTVARRSRDAAARHAGYSGGRHADADHLGGGGRGGTTLLDRSPKLTAIDRLQLSDAHWGKARSFGRPGRRVRRTSL